MNTKKISWLGLGLFVAVAMASCDNIEDSPAQPITNPQEPIYDSATIQYTPVTTINASNPEGEAQVATYTAEGLPEGFSIGGTLQLSTDADFSKMIQTPLVSDGSSFYASLADMAAQYTDNFTKSPEVVNMYGRVILTAENGTDKVRLGTIDTYYGQAQYTFTPAAPDEVISPAYYIVMGNGSAWDFSGAIKMNHEGANQYDNPKFSKVINAVSSLGDKWIVMGEESYNSAKGSGSLAGVECLIPAYFYSESGVDHGEIEKNNSGSFTVGDLPSMVAPCEIEINMQNKTYTSKAAVEKYYATGDGWSGWGGHWMPMSTTNYSDYYGFLNLESQFKFSPNPAWNGDFGAKEAPVETENNGVYTYVGVCHDDKENIQVGHAGLYFASLNVVTWEYTLQQIKSWGLIGDFNSWGGDIEMTPSADLYTWTAELTVADGQGWKFRANGDWAVNLGGKTDELWNNGDNIVLPAGTYTITLDLTTYPSKFTAVKK